MKTQKRRYWFRLKINPCGRPFRRKQIFTVKSDSEEQAEFDLRRMFRFFSDHHHWDRKYTVLEVSKKPLK